MKELPLESWNTRNSQSFYLSARRAVGGKIASRASLFRFFLGCWLFVQDDPKR